MIYDVRIYDLKHGKVNEYMDAVREVALPLRKEYGVELAGWFYTIIGPITPDNPHLAVRKPGAHGGGEGEGGGGPEVARGVSAAGAAAAGDGAGSDNEGGGLRAPGLGRNQSPVYGFGADVGSEVAGAVFAALPSVA